MPQPSTILDHPLVSSRYFFPRHEAFPNPYWVDAADGSKLACSYHVVNPDAVTVVYFHGNGEVVADYLPAFPNWLTRAGYNVLLAEYRGYGMSTGQPALVGMLEDVSAIMRSLNIPDRRLVLFGRSHRVALRPTWRIQAPADCWSDCRKRHCPPHRTVFYAGTTRRTRGVEN